MRGIEDIKSSDAEEKKNRTGSDCEGRQARVMPPVEAKKIQAARPSREIGRAQLGMIRRCRQWSTSRWRRQDRPSLLEVPPFDFQISRDCGVSGDTCEERDQEKRDIASPRLRRDSGAHHYCLAASGLTPPFVNGPVRYVKPRFRPCAVRVSETCPPWLNECRSTRMPSKTCASPLPPADDYASDGKNAARYRALRRAACQGTAQPVPLLSRPTVDQAPKA
jgi:hypothetical protein